MAAQKHKNPSVFDYLDYREFIVVWIREVPIKKRGQLTQMAVAAQLHKASLSQILHGSKEFSLEQAERVAKFLGLSFAETDFFLLLVNYARAGSASLRENFKRQIESAKKGHEQLVSRVTRSRHLSSEERAIFYSNWIYSAVRNLSAVESYGTPTSIAQKLGLSLGYVNQVLEFLLASKLCISKDGEIRPGPQMTHLEADSPLISRHHANWRLKAMERHPVLDVENELAYSAPMTISAKDALRVRTLLAEVVERMDEIVAPSPSEKLYCMCLDWFQIG